MKLINYLLIVLVFVFVSSCKEETEPIPSFAKDYGDGMYIVTDNGVSFYDGNVVKNQIYKEVNGSAISNPKKIKFKGTKAYIVTDNQIVTANVESFENREIIGEFVNATDFDFVQFDRIFVVDKGDAKVKAVDLVSLDITSNIETGDVTYPSFIISKWYRSFILNSGAVADSLKDSTIISIDYRDEAVPLANFMASIEVGENPNSAVLINNFKILCKGIYDEDNLLSNTFSSLSKVHPWDMELIWNVSLDLYNAKNLTSNNSGSILFFTANGGVYNMNEDGTSITNVIPISSDVLFVKTESYAVNDTTNGYSNMLYINDAVNNPNTVYKFNQETDLFCDTIVVNAPVKDIAFY
jgi:hypothetical protein